MCVCVCHVPYLSVPVLAGPLGRASKQGCSQADRAASPRLLPGVSIQKRCARDWSAYTHTCCSKTATNLQGKVQAHVLFRHVCTCSYRCKEYSAW